MSPDPIHPAANELVSSFVDELAHTPDVSALLARLRRGHYPDRSGWCYHPGHAQRWERYPCSAVRLADMAEQRMARPWDWPRRLTLTLIS